MAIDPVTLAITAAMMAASMALTASQKFEGGRLDSLDVSTADYGTPLPRFWGITKNEPTIIWAEKLREQKKVNKTKGGKYSEYKYFGTWAVAIADHEIDSVSRIWFDKRLVYDVTGAGPISIGAILFGENSKILRAKNMRIYLGTETQLPDPRIEAWCEDRYGADSCPAYRGVAYIVFQDVPLEKFGNRIPQISVEAISTASTYFVSQDRLDDDTDWDNPVLSKGSARLMLGDPTAFQIWDLPTRTKLIQGALPGWLNPSLPSAVQAIDSNGRIWAVIDKPSVFNEWSLASWNSDGLSGPVTTEDITDVAGDFYPLSILQALDTSEGIRIGMTGAADVAGLTVGAVPEVKHTSEMTSSSWTPMFWTVDGNRDPWVVGQSGSDAVFYKWKTVGAESFTVALGGTPVDGMAVYHYSDDTHDQFLLFTSLGLFLIDMTGTILSGPLAFFGDDVARALRSTPPGQSTLFFSNNVSQLYEYSCIDGTLLRTMPASDWVTGGLTSNGVYDPVNHAWISFDSALGGVGNPGLRWYFIDRVTNGGELLSTIVGDVAEWCDVEVDASNLDQLVQGYSVTQGAGKDMIEPLLDIHDSDARPHDFTIQFIKRGAAPALTMETANFVKEGDEPRYTTNITQDTDLPRKMTLNFADVGKDQQTNTVISQRPLDAVDTVREMTIDMTTYASDPAEAQQLTDRYFRRQWVGRESTSLGLTAQELALEPGDVRILDLDGVTRTARCTKIVLSAGALKTEWVRDFPGLATLGTGTGAPMEGRDPEVIYIPSPSKGFVLDIPLITDADNNVNPLLYYGAGKYLAAASWPGATVYEGDPDGEEYDDWNAVDSSQGSTWGYATDVLDDANPWVWDRGNTVNIEVRGGALSSVTEADIDADPTLNLAYFGGELLNFATATLEADGTYTLSGFKRGRRGTEWACATHAVGNEFVMVANLLNQGVGLSEVGEAESFKVATFGRSPDASEPIEFTFAGNSLKPYAPARVKWVYDGTDLLGTIIRRTRVGGAWIGNTTIPLSEASEEYEIDVYNGATFKRTITVSGTNMFTYTAAMAAADSITLPTPPTIEAYQLSDAVGRGFALAA